MLNCLMPYLWNFWPALYFAIVPINSDLNVNNCCSMELLTERIAWCNTYCTHEILKSIKGAKNRKHLGHIFFFLTYWFLALYYLPHERPKKAGKCKEWLQLVSEGRVCVCVCLLCACVRCYSLCARKRSSINTPGRFRFHVQGGAVGHAIHISSALLIHDCINRIPSIRLSPPATATQK